MAKPFIFTIWPALAGATMASKRRVGTRCTKPRLFVGGVSFDKVEIADPEKVTVVSGLDQSPNIAILPAAQSENKTAEF